MAGIAALYGHLSGTRARPLTRSVASARQACRARAVSTSPVISRKIHGDMALCRPMLARADALLCEPPNLVERLDCSTAWLQAGRDPAQTTPAGTSYIIIASTTSECSYVCPKP